VVVSSSNRRHGFQVTAVILYDLWMMELDGPGCVLVLDSGVAMDAAPVKIC
jgi:hypothetical protein